MKVRQLAFFLVFIMQGSALYGASFDCGKASTSVEKIICGSPELTDLDSRLDDVYKASLATANLSAKAELIQQQREWIKAVRNHYRDAAFMAIAYDARIEQLRHPEPPKTGNMKARRNDVLDFKGLRIGEPLDDKHARLVFQHFACHDLALSKLMASIEKQPVLMCRGQVIFQEQPMDALVELHENRSLSSILLTYDTPYPEGGINSMSVADMESRLITMYGLPDILRTESPRQPVQYQPIKMVESDTSFGGDSWAFAKGASIILEPGTGHQNEEGGHIFNTESVWFTSNRVGIQITIPAGHAIPVSLTKISQGASAPSSGTVNDLVTVQLYPDGKRICRMGKLVSSVEGSPEAPTSTTIKCTEFVQIADSATHPMPPTIVYIFNSGAEVARGYLQLSATKASLEHP